MQFACYTYSWRSCEDLMYLFCMQFACLCVKTVRMYFVSNLRATRTRASCKDCVYVFCMHTMSSLLLRMLKVTGLIPCRGCTDLYCARGTQKYCPRGLGCDQSIGSTVSDAIVRSWLWSTATRSSHRATSVALLQVVNNWPDSILLCKRLRLYLRAAKSVCMYVYVWNLRAIRTKPFC